MRRVYLNKIKQKEQAFPGWIDILRWDAKKQHLPFPLVFNCVNRVLGIGMANNEALPEGSYADNVVWES